MNTEKNQIYKKIIENIKDAIWVGDKDEKTVYANQNFLSIVGYTLDEVVGKKSYIFWDKKSEKTVKEVNKNDRSRGINSSYYGNLVSKTGKEIPVHITGYTLSDGGTIGIMADIRGQHKKEMLEKILSQSIELSSDAIFTTNKKGDIISWNNGANVIFGLTSKEAKQMNISQIFGEDESGYFLSQKKGLARYNAIATKKEDEKIHTSLTITYIKNPIKEETLSFLFIARDISDTHKNEKALLSKYEKIKDAYEYIGILKRQNEYFSELSEMFSENHDNPQKIYDFIVNSMMILSKLDGCELITYDEKTGKNSVVSHFGFNDCWDGKQKHDFKRSLSEKAFKQKQALKVLNIHKEPLYESINLAQKNHMVSLILFPLSYKGSYIGSISLYAKSEKSLEIYEVDFLQKYTKVIELVMR